MYKVISSRCSLTNFLTKFTNSSDSPFPVRMLFLGDSLDRNTMEDTCLFYDGKNHRDSSPKNFSSPHNCSYGNISIMFRYIPGVSIDGPFFQAIDGNPPGKCTIYITTYVLYGLFPLVFLQYVVGTVNVLFINSMMLTY